MLHDDAKREYAYGPAQGLPDTKVGTFPPSLYDEAQRNGWIVRELVDWYNEEHYHAGLALLHPVDVHYGRAADIVAARQRVLDEAHLRHPERFVRGQPTQKTPPTAAWINPPVMDPIASADHAVLEGDAAQ
jgi:hypothetical protein